MITALTLTAKITTKRPKIPRHDRFVARKAIVADPEESGLMVEIKQ